MMWPMNAREAQPSSSEPASTALRNRLTSAASPFRRAAEARAAGLGTASAGVAGQDRKSVVGKVLDVDELVARRDERLGRLALAEAVDGQAGLADPRGQAGEI